MTSSAPLGLTSEQLSAGLKSLAAFPWAHLADAAESRFQDRGLDVLAARDIVALLDAFNVAIPGDVRMALAVAGFLFPHFERRGAPVGPEQLELPLGESANGS